MRSSLPRILILFIFSALFYGNTLAQGVELRRELSLTLHRHQRDSSIGGRAVRAVKLISEGASVYSLISPAPESILPNTDDDQGGKILFLKPNTTYLITLIPKSRYVQASSFLITPYDEDQQKIVAQLEGEIIDAFSGLFSRDLTVGNHPSFSSHLESYLSGEAKNIGELIEPGRQFYEFDPKTQLPSELTISIQESVDFNSILMYGGIGILGGAAVTGTVLLIFSLESDDRTVLPNPPAFPSRP